MASERFGRDERPAEATEDPVSDEAESERDEGPAPGVPSLADRLGAAARKAMAALAAGAIARLPVVRAAMLPRLPRLVVTIVGGLLLCASFPSLSWWWAAVVAAALLAWVLNHPATTPWVV